MASSAPQSFVCPITGEIMADPVATSDGFSYEREAIVTWFANGHQTSPLTGAPLSRADLVPNHTLRAAIQEYVDAHPETREDIYRPRDVLTIQQTIVSRQWATPQVVDSTPVGVPLYSDESMPTTVAAGESIPMLAPVAVVQPPPPPPLTGLTGDDLAAARELAVPDWLAFLAPKKVPSSGWFGMGGGSSQRGARDGTHPDEPRLRVVPVAQGGLAEFGGVTLEANVHSESGLLRLVRRLVAPGTAPVCALRVKAEQEGSGFGTMAEGFSADGPAFALLSRALFAVSGNGAESLRNLVELSITKLTIRPAPAAALAAALHDHHSLRHLELWNCGIDDEGAMSLGRLATIEGNRALREFNLGRNLISGHCRDQLEALIDRQRVHAKMY